MQLSETDTRPENRRVSSTNSDRDIRGNQEAIPPHLQNGIATDTSEGEPVLLSILGIGFAVVVVNFLLAFGQQMLLYVLAKANLFSMSLPMWREIYGVGMFLFSAVVVVSMGYLIGTIANRRAIVPGIIAGHVVSQGIYLGFVFPRVLAATHATMPTSFWGQMLLGVITGTVTEIAVALLVANRKNKAVTSYSNLAR